MISQVRLTTATEASLQVPVGVVLNIPKSLSGLGENCEQETAILPAHLEFVQGDRSGLSLH